MKLSQMPDGVRQALARRELARRGATANAGQERIGEAVSDLYVALRELLPDEPVVFAEVAQFYARWAHPQPPGHREKVEALAARINAGETTTADLSVLAALPADALAVLGMPAAGFVTMLQSVEDRCGASEGAPTSA